MHCPSCSKETPDNSRFCLQCGAYIAAATQRAPIRWEYRDFVSVFPEQGACPWVKVSGEGAYTKPAALLSFWNAYQGELSLELQKWYDEGWQPVGDVGPACFETRTVTDCRSVGCVMWALGIVFGILSAGLLLLALYLISRASYLEATRFVVHMRRPKEGA